VKQQRAPFEGSPAAKLIESLCACSVDEIAIALASAAGAAVEPKRREGLRKAAEVLLRRGRGAPRRYDNAQALAEIRLMLEGDQKMSVWAAAGFVASSTVGEHSVYRHATRSRFYKEFCRQFPEEIRRFKFNARPGLKLL
jgi:hypothetical protein